MQDHNHLGAQAFRLFRALIPPLPISIEHTETIRKSRRHLLIKKLAPARRADCTVLAIDRTNGEVQLGANPLRLRRPRNITLQGRTGGIMGVNGRRRRAGTTGDGDEQRRQ
ncbi:hypothetical protein D3C81_1925670 [compost metagenome]